jgi:GNAT superfamily N-acetyltransferase
MTIRWLERGDVPGTARVIAAAMDVDAAYRHLFPDPSARRAGLEELFSRNLAIHLAHRCTWVTTDARGDVVGTVTLRPLGGISISRLTMIRRGLLPFAVRHGRGAVKRLLWLKDVYDGLERDLAAGDPHFYVHMMAVAPELQGRGVGGALLREVLERTGATSSRHPLVLTTHLPENVTFYRRQGFETVWERRLAPPMGERYSVWGMRRG